MASFPYLTLESIRGDIYNFPQEFWIDSGSIQNNINVINRFYTAGGANVADGFLQSRSISIRGILRADDSASLEVKKQAFTIACLGGGKLTLSDDIKPRFLNISSPSFSYGQEAGRLYQEITVDFLVEFPYWQDSEYQTHEETLSGDSSFIVDTTGTVDIVAPIIEITATDTGGLPGVTMRNLTDGANEWTYSDNNFQLGDILVIDSVEGTVKLNNTSTVEKLNPAVWLRLQRGENTIEYEGAACTLVVKWRGRYLLNG